MVNDRLLDQFGRGLLSVVVMLIALAVAALLLVDGWRIVVVGLLGSAATVAGALAFYLVGRSEDRARSRERAARRRS